MSTAGNPPIPFAAVEGLHLCLIRMADVECEMEGLSELDHALQCAEVLRVMAPDDLELQIAGLVHDVGNLYGPDRDHGRIGERAVQGLLGERIAQLIRLHVDAKRYLVASDPSYRTRLSPVSLVTLERQGGLMDGAEIAAFQANPFHADAIRLRQADDLAKTPGKVTRGLDAWIPALRKVCQSTR